MRLTNELSDWQKVVRLVGEDDAAVLSAEFAGARLYVPKLIGRHHPITVCVGEAGAAVLAAHFGGRVLDVPISLGKRAMIVQLLKGGLSVRSICQKVGVSRRTVFYVKASERGGEDDPQADLFRPSRAREA